jgi:hypothetical protein
MTRYSKVNIVYRLQKWMDSVPGQTFLNYAYSWGAAVVILGTLFKLTHLPGANLMLYLGMGTEVVVFFLSAFDRPFDKTADGMDLPTHLNQEVEGTVVTGTPVETPAVAAAVTAGTTGVTGGPQTIIIGGGGGYESHESHKPYKPNEAYKPNDVNEPNEAYEPNEVQEPAPVNASAPVIPPLTPDMTEATNAYVEELKKLTEVLERVSEQSKRLTTDSEEMENLNRTLTGICKVYEMQLKSASSQIGTIDEINEQTKKMAQQIEQLNNIYARMIEAMTMKMKVE